MSDAVVNGLAGAGGGIIAQILTYPLQVVNTRQQTERKAKSSILNVEDSILSKEQRKRRQLNTLQEIYRLIKEDGWQSLYSGLAPSLVGTAASQGVYYYFYQVFKNRAETISLEKRSKGFGDGTVGVFSSLVIAALAGCLNVLSTIPIWVVVTRMQTHSQAQKKAAMLQEARKKRESTSLQDVGNSSLDTMSSSSSLNNLTGVNAVQPYSTRMAVQELYNEAGLMGFWKGVLPTLIMVSNPAIQFMLYESMLKQLRLMQRKANKAVNISALQIFLVGAIAKLGATVATYPLLVVKSRLQAKQEIGGDKSLQYTGTFDAIIKMIRFEGLTGFYKGMNTKIVQSVFSAAVLFMIKEELVKGAYLLKENHDKIVVKVKRKPGN